MSNAAKVLDIDALKAFRAAMLTFAEKATNSLGEADAEIQRVASWLENEQAAYWTSELRKRHTAVVKAKEALQFKQIYKSPTGGRQSTVDEEKALALAMRRYQEAEVKMANVKKWIRQLHKESHLYRGSVQRLGTTVSVDVPNAAAKISRMVIALEGYVALATPSTANAVEGSDASVARGSAEPAPIDVFARVRQTTPTPAEKDAAPRGDPTVEWTSGEFAVGDEQSIETLAFERENPDPGASVIIAAGVQCARRIFLHRSAPAFPSDSGWFVGHVDAQEPTPGYLSLRICELLALRPLWKGLLSMPAGTLAILDPAGLATLLDERDADLLKSNPPAAI